MSDSKKIKWTALAMMGFSTVWGFGNVLNGFIYFACHITYIASKGSGSLKALSWMVFRNAKTYDSFPTLYVQLPLIASSSGKVVLPEESFFRIQAMIYNGCEKQTGG